MNRLIGREGLADPHGGADGSSNHQRQQAQGVGRFAPGKGPNSDDAPGSFMAQDSEEFHGIKVKKLGLL